MSIERDFRLEVQNYLAKLSSDIKSVLKKLVEYDYPEEVDTLAFKVFVDRFTQGFPVRAFFMDKDNSEHFVYVDGQAQYPSPVDPELLNIDYVYPYEFEEEYTSKDDELDLYSVATEELIEWFSKYWNEVGGELLKIKANIASHDDINAYNLVEGKWQERH